MSDGVDPQVTLVERLRSLAARHPALNDLPVREVPMFGSRSIMVDDRMVVSVAKNGDLLVRAGPARRAELLARPGARPAEMGTGRTMGPGWIIVEGDTLADDGDLEYWFEVAVAYHAQATSG